VIQDIPSDNPDWKRVEEAVKTLSEFFDAVHLFAIRHETAGEASDGESGDLAFSKGAGSYYARCGLIREWILRQDERSRIAESD
jgi:hypothetical protein